MIVSTLQIAAISLSLVFAKQTTDHVTPMQLACDTAGGSSAQIIAHHDAVVINCPDKREVVIYRAKMVNILDCNAYTPWCQTDPSVGLVGIDVVDPTTSELTLQVDVDVPHKPRSDEDSVDLECSDTSKGPKMILHFKGKGVTALPTPTALQAICSDFLSKWAISGPSDTVKTTTSTDELSTNAGAPVNDGALGFFDPISAFEPVGATAAGSESLAIPSRSLEVPVLDNALPAAPASAPVITTDDESTVEDLTSTPTPTAATKSPTESTPILKPWTLPAATPSKAPPKTVKGKNAGKKPTGVKKPSGPKKPVKRQVRGPAPRPVRPRSVQPAVRQYPVMPAEPPVLFRSAHHRKPVHQHRRPKPRSTHLRVRVQVPSKEVRVTRID